MGRKLTCCFAVLLLVWTEVIEIAMAVGPICSRFLTRVSVL